MKKNYMLVIVSMITVLLLSACGSDSSSSTGKDTTLKLSHFWPSHHIVHTDVLEKLATDIEAETDGSAKIEIYSSGSLGTPQEQFDLVTTNTADIALSVHGYTPGKFPLVSVMDLPFVVTSAEEGSEKLWELYKDFPELDAEHNEAVTLALFTGEPNQIISASKPIKSLEDLKGLKVRSPSTISNQILEALGAVPVSMPVNDIYESLNKGVIDAALAGASTLNDLNLHEVSKHVTIANLSASSMFIVMNKDSYDGLDESQQAALDGLTETLAKQAGAALDIGGQAGYDKAEEAGIEVIELSAAELKRFEEALAPVVKEWITTTTNADLPGQEIYDAAISK